MKCLFVSRKWYYNKINEPPEAQNLFRQLWFSFNLTLVFSKIICYLKCMNGYCIVTSKCNKVIKFFVIKNYNFVLNYFIVTLFSKCYANIV